MDLGNKMAIHHKGGSALDGRLPVGSGGGFLFYNDPSLLGNEDGNDNRRVD